MMDRTRILSFWRKPPAPTNTNGKFQEETVLANLVKSSQQKRHIPKSAELIDDYYPNLLDWSTGNILAIALGNTVYLWNASNGSVVDLWDTTANPKLTTLQGGHQGLVGSLSCDNQILTTGGSDSMIINNDFPSMDKIAKLNGDVSGVFFTAENPNGCTVASAGDEMLMFWNIFGTPEITKPAKKTENAALFSGKFFEGLCRHALNVHIFLKMHRSDYAEKQLKMMQHIDEDYTLTQLANAWLDLAVEAHLIFQDFSEKYQHTGMILIGKAVCCMHMGRFEEAE
ncbi:hypothetical protein MRB53_026471 [Persea americana]|uniref:Uncharacterized protein n=1 Tax=Persea americana TaxID=3435 RepID=A0ACC2LI51_PERAE|nr:hypothetical protein MRB53_026471 [Persea americana]